MPSKNKSTRPGRLHVATLAALLAALVLTPAAPSVLTRRAGAQRAARAGKSTIIFAVQPQESGATIDPVAFVSRGRYAAPPSGGEGYGESKAESARARRFIGDYFRPGRKYRLLFGGGAAGSVEVRKYVEPGCVGMEASVKVETTAKLGGQVMALATDSSALGLKRAWTRRAPTEDERAAALELARRTFRRNRVAAPRVEKMETNNLTAIDHDRAAMLIGSFLIKGEGGVEDAVFLIAEPSAGSFDATLAWFHHGEEAEAHYRRLVDVLDLDADGTPEVIAEGIYYESHDYFIYRKRARAGWQVVYQGGGGGC